MKVYTILRFLPNLLVNIFLVFSQKLKEINTLKIITGNLISCISNFHLMLI